MFIQVIEGRTSNAEALDRQLELWRQELAPGATGYLGSTAGVTDSGDAILIARFESEAAARANSARPDQSAWWADTERCFDGPVRFHDSTDVADMRLGDPDQARFVQVMEGHITDRERAKQLQATSEPLMHDLRPDVLGTTTAFFADGEFAEIVYFSSEDEARRAETQDIPDRAASMLADLQQAMPVERYIDLTQPKLMRV
jgi:hypothetical protein